MRCLRCGRRSPGNPPQCPTHGPVGNDEVEAAAPAAVPGPPAIAGYRAPRLLGRGGFGAVYAAEREQDGLEVAIKLAVADPPEASARLVYEGEALRRIGPPHVPEVWDEGSLPNGTRYLVMELVKGRTLAEGLACQTWPIERTAFAVQAQAILQALAKVHAGNLVHRDIKPENIFLCDRGRGEPLLVLAKLIDFGLVKATSAEPMGPGLTTVGTVVGTTEYMAPEQFTAVASIDRRTDIYAMGAVLYELLTGRPPFWGKPADVQQAHLRQRPPRPSEFAPVPPVVEEIVLRCLAKAQADRFETVDALQRALGEALSGWDDSATTPKKPLPAPEGAAPARAPRERKAMMVVILASKADAASIVRGLRTYGGELAHTAMGRYVGVFGSETVDQPARRALQAAEGLVEQELAERALLDLASVMVTTQADGSRTYLSPRFSKADACLAGDGVKEIWLGRKAAELLGDVAMEAVPVEDNGDGPVRVARSRARSASAPSGGVSQVEETVLRRASTPLVGRDELIAELLQEARARISSSGPGLATLLAEPGFGKSHLGVGLTDRLRSDLPQAQVWELRAREPIEGNTSVLLQQLLRLTFGLPESGSSLEDGRKSVVRTLGEALGNEVLGGVAHVLGWVGPDHPMVQKLRAAPGVLRSTCTRALAEGLRRAAEKRPLFVVVDDAQWADDATLDGLEAATAQEAMGHLWVCVLARPVFEQVRSGWGERAGHARLFRLGPLEAEAAMQLCRRLLEPASNLPESALQRLVDRSQSIPLLLIELVNGLRREGLVRKEEGGSGWYVATEVLDKLPDLPLVQWLAGRELAALPPDVAAHARLASLLTAEFHGFELTEILRTMDRDRTSGAREIPLDAEAGLAELRRANVLVRHRGGTLSFRHALVREAVAATVAPGLRSQIHGAAVEIYRDTDRLEENARLSRFAWHAACAGQRPEAAGAYLRLAEAARAAHAYLDAELFYSRGLEQLAGEGSAERLRAFQGRAIMRYRLARYDDALGDFAAGRKIAAERNETEIEADIVLDEAMALDWIAEWRQSQVLAEEARNLLGERPSTLMAAKLAMSLGRSALRFNQDPDAMRLLGEAALLAEQAGDEAYETLVVSLLLLGFLYSYVGGKLADSEAVFARVIALCQSKGDVVHLGAAYNNRACMWYARNERERLLSDLNEGLECARRLGNTNLENDVVDNLGCYHYQIGELEAAEPYARRLIQLNERRRKGARPQGKLLLGRILLAKGDLEATRVVAEEIAGQQDMARDTGKLEALLVPHEQVMFDTLKLAVAGGTPEAWDELIERSSKVSQAQDFLDVLEVRGVLAEKENDLAVARAAWERALAEGRRITSFVCERIERRLAGLGS